MIAEQFLVAEVGEKGGHRRGGDPDDEDAEKADKGERHRGHSRQTRRAETFQKGNQTLQRTSPANPARCADWQEFA